MQIPSVRKVTLTTTTLSRKEDDPLTTQKLHLRWYFAQEKGDGISSTKFVFNLDEEEKRFST